MGGRAASARRGAPWLAGDPIEGGRPHGGVRGYTRALYSMEGAMPDDQGALSAAPNSVRGDICASQISFLPA